MRMMKAAPIYMRFTAVDLVEDRFGTPSGAIISRGKQFFLVVTRYAISAGIFFIGLVQKRSR